MNKLNSYCRCGHNYGTHDLTGSLSGNMYSCLGVITKFEVCNCMKFRLSNLEYLEQLYDKKVKTND